MYYIFKTRRVIKNLSAILEEVNMTLENVVKTTIFIKNMQDYDIINNYFEHLNYTQSVRTDSQPGSSTRTAFYFRL